MQGESGMAFFGYPYEDGWGFLEGPSGARGHAWNAPGSDGVAFRLEGPFEVQYLDNKSFSRGGNVSSASALVETVTYNLSVMLVEYAKPEYKDVPRIGEIRSALQAARTAIASGRALPDNVRLVVTNYGGASTGVSEELQKLGVEFRNLDVAASVGMRGAPDMEPPLPGRGATTQAAGEAVVAAGMLTLMAAQFALLRISDRVQAKRVRDAIAAHQREIDDHLAGSPYDGVLILLFFAQTKAALVDPMESQIPPDFRFLEIAYGETQQEALDSYQSASHLHAGPGEGLEFGIQQVWIPPRAFRDPTTMPPRERGTSAAEKGTTPTDKGTIRR